MAMFLKSLYKISSRTPNITEIAPRTYELVDYSREKRFWKLVFEGKAGGESSSRFENNFKGTNGTFFLNIRKEHFLFAMIQLQEKEVS